MMKKQELAIAAAALLASVGIANATTISGSLSVTLQSFDGSLPGIVTAPSTVNSNQKPTGTNTPLGTITGSSSPYSLSFSGLNPGSLTTYNLFQINPNPSSGSCGSGCVVNSGLYGDSYPVDTGTIKVTLTVAGYGSITETGTYEAKYGGVTLPCAAGDSNSKTDTDCILWSNTSLQHLTNGTQTLYVEFVNAVDWDITPMIELGFSSSQFPTPLPAALPLFAGGLGVMGLLGGWRKKRKASAATA
jgi:hypothetical protein